MGVTVYSKQVCPFCVRAKQLLDHKGVAYQEVMLDDQPELAKQVVERSGGRRTVPQIFIDDRALGGFDDLQGLERSGLLDQYLQEAGIEFKSNEESE